MIRKFYHNSSCLFIFLIMPFDIQKRFGFDEVQFAYFVAFGVISKNPLSNPRS